MEMTQSKIDQVIKAAIGVLLVALAGVIVYTMQDHIVVAGDSAPNFNLITDNGKQITPTNFGGKVLVLNFWATWCPPCVQEMPSLNQFAATMKDSGVVVLAVSVDKNEKAYKTFVQRARPAFETAHDPDANISSEYGTYKWPETYVIDKNGKVAQ